MQTLLAEANEMGEAVAALAEVEGETATTIAIAQLARITTTISGTLVELLNEGEESPG
jgi:hypothetical protein